MSAHPIGLAGQPRASAIGLGMAMTSGVCMNDRPAGASVRPTFWLTMAAQPLAAGDQMTGAGPFVPGSGQPCSSRVAAAPEDFRATRTATQRSPTLAPESLNVSARSVSSVTFSGETAMSTITQLGSTPGVPAPVPPLGPFDDPPFPPEQATSRPTQPWPRRG